MPTHSQNIHLEPCLTLNLTNKYPFKRKGGNKVTQKNKATDPLPSITFFRDKKGKVKPNFLSISKKYMGHMDF